MQLNLQYAQTTSYKNIAKALLGVGVLVFLLGLFTLGLSKDPVENMRFWAGLLHNSVYFLLVVNASMFFVCATILAMGGWVIGLRRIPEALSKAVPIMGVLTLIILIILMFKGDGIYQHWISEHASHDKLIQHKKPFLTKPFSLAIWFISSTVSSVLTNLS